MTRDLKTPLPPAASSPTASGKRYLSQLMDHAFREGWRTPDDFVRYFPAHSIMGALKSAPELRVKLLAAATGIYEEILRRKTPALAAEDLRIALEEGTTNSLQLLNVFTPEDRVRYLDPHRIWDFLAEDQFWLLDSEAGEEQRRGATERMVFTLTQALTERLFTLRDVLDGVTYDAVADSLSPHELRAVVRFALLKGRDGIGLNEKVLLEVLPLEKLVRSVPLDHTWQEVVIRRLAIPCGFTDLSREERRTSQAGRRIDGERRRGPGRVSGAPALPGEAANQHSHEHQVTAPPPSGFGSPDAEFSAHDDLRTAVPPAVAMVREGSLLPPPPSHTEGPRSSRPAPDLGAAELTDDFNHPLPSSRRFEPSDFDAQAFERNFEAVRSPPPSAPSQPVSSRPLSVAPAAFDAPASDSSERQRQRVLEHLRAIGRLPPNHPALPTAVLRSIDAMYALLPSATDDIQRKSVIRQTFANENHLRAALLGLIELMDSSVDTSDPVIQGAKIEALIKILLFEEQRRKETGRFPSGAPASGRSPVPLSYPPGAYPPSSYPPGSYPPGSYPSGSYPPGSYSQGGYPSNNYPSGSYPSSSYPPSYRGANHSEGGVPAGSFPEGYPGGPPENPYASLPTPSVSSAPHVATQRPPPPVLGYPASAPPLPNLPADPVPSRRRTVPPPLPPSYPRG